MYPQQSAVAASARDLRLSHTQAPFDHRSQFEYLAGRIERVDLRMQRIDPTNSGFSSPAPVRGARRGVAGF